MNETAKKRDQVNQEIQKLFNELKQEKDELRVKLNLAGLEIRDQWEIAEEKWQHFTQKCKSVTHEAKEASILPSQSIKKLGHELKESYRKLRRSI